MTSLQTELQRLYASPNDGQGLVRAALLGLGRPADWAALASVWRGVQADLDLPAPAIAVSGTAGFELWFSFVEPLPQAQVAAFIEALRVRYLADVDPARVDRRVASDAALPPQKIGDQEQWSAFVAPDLAPVFGAEPWLDIAPGPEGQADLLRRLASIKSAEMRAALDRLGVTRLAPAPPPPAAESAHSEASLDPERFLLRVMNDEGVALGLRIEAAKALLQAKK